MELMYVMLSISWLISLSITMMYFFLGIVHFEFALNENMKFFWKKWCFSKFKFGSLWLVVTAVLMIVIHSM
jgi:hypothetical protein